MTTTTRKTRKAPWAAVMTAVLAVLALVFGTVAFAGTATARSDPATECAGVENLVGSDTIEVEGSLKSGDTLTSGAASITVTADKEGTEATGGTWATTLYTARIVVKSGDKADPGANGVPGYSGAWWTGSAQDQTDQGLSHITFCYSEETPPPATDVDLTCTAWTATFTDFPSEAGYRVTVDDVTVGTGVLTTSPVTVGDSGTFGSGEHSVKAYVTDELVRTEAITLTCTGPTLYAGGATYPNVKVCYGPDVIEVGPVATPYVTEQVYLSQNEADAAAKQHVTDTTDSATATYMNAHPEYASVPADGICIHTPPPPPTPETVAPVLPATVEEPVTVAVPQPATVPMPAQVPTPVKVAAPATVAAGDGTTAPTVPTALLALLALAGTTLAVTTVRLLKVRS